MSRCLGPLMRRGLTGGGCQPCRKLGVGLQPGYKSSNAASQWVRLQLCHKSSNVASLGLAMSLLGLCTVVAWLLAGPWRGYCRVVRWLLRCSCGWLCRVMQGCPWETILARSVGITCLQDGRAKPIAPRGMLGLLLTRAAVAFNQSCMQLAPLVSVSTPIVSVGCCRFCSG